MHPSTSAKHMALGILHHHPRTRRVGSPLYTTLKLALTIGAVGGCQRAVRKTAGTVPGTASIDRPPI
ncbi:hypothetical protein F383_23666 [Gossypium arboreum]|uniref:Uncharacterized protein n=1 Tax=Gossypium arboreum TaxID=29729 RepID=A0A0B0MRU7_GOSAR|nr:hypothetical protein F383_23666 [Gossypium arboreum]